MPNPTAPNPKKQEAIQLRKQGLTYGQIAKQLGVNEKSVPGWCSQARDRELAKQAKEAQANGQSASLAPLQTVNPTGSHSTQNTNAESNSGQVQAEKRPLTEDERLYRQAKRALRDHMTGKKLLTTGQLNAAKGLLGSLKPGKGSKAGGQGESEADLKTVYHGMGDRELADRVIASACEIVGLATCKAILGELESGGHVRG